MKNFLKVIIIVVIAGVLTACMNTSDEKKESETNEQNKTNNEQTEEEYNQEDPDNQKDSDRNNDYKNNENRNNQQGNFDRNKDGQHHKEHHGNKKRTPTSKNNQEEIVLENEAFQIFEPAPKTIVKDQFVVRGLARVFEGTIQYRFEDNHSILDEGYTTASLGAPEWGEFEIIIEVDKSAHHSARIILYEESAKDGSKMNELIIPVHANK